MRVRSVVKQKPGHDAHGNTLSYYQFEDEVSPISSPMARAASTSDHPAQQPGLLHPFVTRPQHAVDPELRLQSDEGRSELATAVQQILSGGGGVDVPEGAPDVDVRGQAVDQHKRSTSSSSAAAGKGMKAGSLLNLSLQAGEGISMRSCSQA
jgi:hypothetical protein